MLCDRLAIKIIASNCACLCLCRVKRRHANCMQTEKYDEIVIIIPRATFNFCSDTIFFNIGANLMSYYNCLCSKEIEPHFLSAPLRIRSARLHGPEMCSDPKRSTFVSGPKRVRIVDPKLCGYFWPRVDARPICTKNYPDTFGSDPVETGY